MDDPILSSAGSFFYSFFCMLSVFFLAYPHDTVAEPLRDPLLSVIGPRCDKEWNDRTVPGTDENGCTEACLRLDAENGKDVGSERLFEKSTSGSASREHNEFDVLRRGITISERIETDKAGTLDTKDTDAEITPEQTYNIYSNETPGRKHHLRAALEIGGFLGIATGYYWNNIGASKDDWDFGVNADNLKGRFITGDAHRFDNNELDLNLGHAAAGTSYYLLARSNNLNAFESFLFTSAGSAVWEFLSEFREVVSINDNIMTPVGGFAIGEVMFQLGEFFRHSSDSVVNQMLATLFSPPATFHRWVDKNSPKPPEDTDRFGFSTDVRHRFDLSAGYGISKSHDTNELRSGPDLGVRLELITIDKYAEPGQFHRWYTGGTFNELAVRSIWGDGDWTDFLFSARTAFAGYYRQCIRQEERSGGLEGYSLFAGAGTAFEYMAHRFSGFEKDDKLAVIDLIGPFIDLNFFYRGVRVHASMEAYPNFAAVRPFAIDEFAEKNSLEGAKTVLKDQRYYYALGATAGAELGMEYKDYEIGTRLRYHYFDSIEGRDRYQENVTHDFNLTDQRLSVSVNLGYTLPLDFLKIAFVSEKLFRDSRIGDFNADQQETRFFSQLIFQF